MTRPAYLSDRRRLPVAGPRPGRGLLLSYWFLSTLLLGSVTLSAQSQRIDIGIGVTTQEVYLGDSFLYQIQIQGSDKPGEPDLSQVNGFSFTLQSSGPRNRQMVYEVNGQRTETISRGYLLTYQVTPQMTGDITIPSLRVPIEGEFYSTRPVTIRVRKPVETDDFKLRLFLSKTGCYAGEPVILTVRWYIGADKKVTSVNNFSVPALNAGQFGSVFTFKATEAAPPQSNDYVALPVEGEQVYARYGRESLNGRSFTTLTFSRILVPKKTGVFTLPQATISFMGREESAQSAWDFFGSEEKKYVIPSNALTLTVRELPQDNRPANFSGLLGHYTLAATVAPQEVRVGDPITLTIKVGGDGYLGDLKLPPLDSLANFTSGFKLSPDNPPGKLTGQEKVFRYVLRAAHEKVEAIPPLELVYFDTQAGSYKTLRTPPLPLKVLPAASNTGQDAGGAVTEPLKQEVETSTEGIAFNYEGLDVLSSEDYSLASLVFNPLWISLLLLPCLAYLAILVLFRFGPLAAVNTLQRAKKQALVRVQKTLSSLKTGNAPAQEACDQILGVLRNYLGLKLELPAAALTYKDLEPALQARGVASGQLAELAELFRFCEASRYAGYAAADTAAIKARLESVQKLITAFERILK